VRISLLPESLFGKCSFGLAAAFFILLLALGVDLTKMGHVIIGPVGPYLGVALKVSSIAAFVTGLISVIKSKERSILVFLAVAVGGFFTFLFLFPY